MNTLSWFLYLAGIAPALCRVLIVLFLLLLVVSVIVNCVRAAMIETSNLEGFKLNEKHNELFNGSEVFIKEKFKIDFSLVKYMVFATLLFCIIPTEKTIYMIAASEAGEHVVTSEEGKEILNDLRTILKQQIKVD